MKEIILLLLISVTFTYNTTAAVEYAEAHWKLYNNDYNDYSETSGEDANYVAQCLIAGGLDLKGCSLDNMGSIKSHTNLATCLKIKSWKSSTTKPKSFKTGYPIFIGSHPVIANNITNNDITFCSHSFDVCDASMNGLVANIVYYYL